MAQEPTRLQKLGRQKMPVSFPYGIGYLAIHDVQPLSLWVSEDMRVMVTGLVSTEGAG